MRVPSVQMFSYCKFLLVILDQPGRSTAEGTKLFQLLLKFSEKDAVITLKDFVNFNSALSRN